MMILLGIFFAEFSFFLILYILQLSIPVTAFVEGEDFLQKVGEFRSKQRIPVSHNLHIPEICDLRLMTYPKIFNEICFFRFYPGYIPLRKLR